MIDLSGEWLLCDQQQSYSLTMMLPGDVVSALQHAQIVPDPYRGRNEYDVRWIAERDWIVSRIFHTDKTDLSLILQDVDTIAEVSINGAVVATTQNSFRTYKIDVSDTLLGGENEITIRFASSPRIAAKLQEDQPFYVPWHKENCPIANGNMLRKVQCDFGWDWNIALAPLGVYGRMELEQNRPATIGQIRVDQISTNERADVTVTVAIIGQGGGGSINVEFAGENRTIEIVDNSATADFSFNKPDLWWPFGLGDQVLHDLTVTLDDQAETRRVGLRSIDLVTETDAAGLGFKFRINDHDTFMRGADWIPADALPGRITKEKTRALLQSAVDANMNMIRVWGGGRYEPDYFYDFCDEMGLLIWHDFMFACNLYPSTPAFLAEVDAEVREQTARLGHHASIALWCGDNELIGALTWFEESRKDRDRYLVSYDRLNRTVETALKDTLPNANWWPSSPSPGPMNFGDAWHDDGSGDMHFWSVWHEGRDFSHYRDVKPRFCSEFGFQSFPSMNVIRDFADEKDWNIASPVMESHQKNAGGNARIAETMFRYFRFPVGFENFVYLSQVQQGLAIKTAVDYWRSIKPHCMGALYWQLNDTWPVASWSSLDYGGNWKLLHHMAKDFFEPAVVVAVPTDDNIALIAINDLRDQRELRVTAYAVSMSGTQRELGAGRRSINSTENAVLLNLPKQDLQVGEILYFEWAGPDGIIHSDHFTNEPYKTLDLQNPEIEFDITPSGEGWEVTLTCQTLALFVALEADSAGRFSDNAFTMLPGRKKALHFVPDVSDKKPEITVRDLFTATYGTA
ncbi:glycoside hydrolase family 2 protein [Pararhizobium sp. IMCC21322]|uniref:beta-mannosidase n=1 Tax=Pararhizobium sp. IMCC21322 TaxID=3067903 RepID=UPI0027427D14|nr:glycoside hydrolase family 2 protein [Pararhizobium sp. IMCC21322]